MKRTISIILCVVMLMSVSTTAAFAATTYEQPFNAGTIGSQTFRIPALITLNDGSVLAGADIRYGHGSDSPNNIDIVVAKSADGYTGWKYNTVFYFGDYADGVTETASASYIDSALIQSKTTDRIFMVTDAQPSGCGYNQAMTGTGFTTIDGNKYLLLTDGNNTDALDTFNYYVGDYIGLVAPVYAKDGTMTAYSVDRELNLYKNGLPLYMDQKGADGVKVQQNVYYNDSELCCYCTTYLVMRYSDDGGATWSAPVNLSAQVKKDSEGFLGIAPGRGFVTEVDGKERIIFMVYDNDGLAENVSTIYSDDNGVTWNRGNETIFKLGVMKTSESQIVELNNGVLRMFARNGSSYVAYADSTDGGVSWSTFEADMKLSAQGNCMLSFINTSKVIDGKKVILGSYSSNVNERADGVVKVGLVADDNTIEWISTYHVNSGFYAYSCLTELADGNFGLLYEDEAYHISYMVLTLSEDGTVSEINSNNVEYEKEEGFFEAILRAIKEMISRILYKLGLM